MKKNVFFIVMLFYLCSCSKSNQESNLYQKEAIQSKEFTDLYNSWRDIKSQSFKVSPESISSEFTNLSLNEMEREQDLFLSNIKENGKSDYEYSDKYKEKVKHLRKKYKKEFEAIRAFKINSQKLLKKYPKINSEELVNLKLFKNDLF